MSVRVNATATPLSPKPCREVQPEMLPNKKAGRLPWLVKASLVTKLKRGMEMCRRSACPWNSYRHTLIPVKKNWYSSASPSAFVHANIIYLQV